jgi:hypothetical protein
MSDNLFVEGLAYSFDQRLGILIKMKSAHFNCLATRERLQGFRELAYTRHGRPIN